MDSINSSETNLFDAYGSIYKAGVRPELWSDSLSRIQYLFDIEQSA